MGEGGKDALGVGFDGSLRLELHASTLMSDAGLIPYRQLDEALGTKAMAGSILQDQRTGRNTRHTMTALLRQSVYSRLAGYEDTNDADRICVGPTMRCIVGGRAGDARAASTSQIRRFETQSLILHIRRLRVSPNPAGGGGLGMSAIHRLNQEQTRGAGGHAAGALTLGPARGNHANERRSCHQVMCLCESYTMRIATIVYHALPQGGPAWLAEDGLENVGLGDVCGVIRTRTGPREVASPTVVETVPCLPGSGVSP